MNLRYQQMSTLSTQSFAVYEQMVSENRVHEYHKLHAVGSKQG